MENDKLLLFLLVKSVYLGHHLITGPNRWLNYFPGLGLDEYIIKKIEIFGIFFCSASLRWACSFLFFLFAAPERVADEDIVLSPAKCQ